MYASTLQQVHVFDRNADETISWISEKDAFISSEDYGHDLETIQGLARKHQGFERDLAAVKEQVIGTFSKHTLRSSEPYKEFQIADIGMEEGSLMKNFDFVYLFSFHISLFCLKYLQKKLFSFYLYIINGY